MHPRLVFVAAAVLVAAALTCAAPARANGIVVESTSTPSDPEGLSSSRGATAVVLVAHRVHARVDDGVADVEVEQVFRNRTGATLEGVYLFPLPEGAAVSRFAMTIGGRLVEGEVVAADRARAIYEDIVRRRRDPGLLEYAGRGLYRARVFPIPSHGEVRVRLAYQQVLTDDAGTLELRYPLATDRLNGAPVDEVSVTVDVRSAVDLKAVYSPTHAVEVQRSGERAATVTWARQRAAVDRDLVLYLGRGEAAFGLSLLSHKPLRDDGTFVAVLTPRVAPVAGEEVPKDVIFVLDTSGSMQGEKLVLARRAVTLGVDLLRPGDRFAVVTFSSTVQRFRETLSDATPAARADARAWLDERGAIGGTDLEGGLLAGLAFAAPGRLPLVVLVTDGLPTVGTRDAGAIVARATAANTAHARVFTFGVGADVDVTLLDRVAEGTGGARDYVTGGEDLEHATGRLFAKVRMPVLVDVTVDFGLGVHDVYPARIPTVFAGQQVVVFGRYRHPGVRTVRVRGTLAGRAVELEMTGRLGTTPGPAYVERLWAQRKVAYLLDAIRLHGVEAELVHEIEDLGTRYALVTPYTSGLVVEDEGPPVPPGLRDPSDPAPPPPPPTSVPPTTSAPTTPSDTPVGPTTPSPSAPAVSRRLRDRKDAGSAEDADAARAGTRVVDGRTFVREAATGRYVDTAWDRKAPTQPVEAFSPAYFELLARGDTVARILALGDRVVFVLDGAAYEVVPARPSR